MPTDNELRTILALVTASLAHPDESDEVTELEHDGDGRLFGVQPSERSSESFTVLVESEV